MKKIYALFTIAVLVFSMNFSNAQPMEKTKYMIWEVQLSPEQLQNGIKAITAENAFFKEKGNPYMNVTQYSNDGYLWYSIPFKKFADLDEIEKTMQNLWKENPEKSKEIQKMFDVSYTQLGRIIIESQPELSIQGKPNEGTPTGSKFRVFEKFYIKPGMNEKFEELTKRFVELRKKNNINSGFYTFYPVFAQDMDAVYFIDEMGSNPAEHFALNDEQWKKFGEDGQKLWQDVIKVISKMESHLGQINYDLMYVPAK